MKTIAKVILAFGVFSAFSLCLLPSTQADPVLVKAFAFGANEWTRATYNEASVDYIKVAQETGLNWDYSAAQGHGYTDYTALDASPNNREVYSGDDEIYDQFVGAKLSAGPDPLLFRIDVENGNYKFVAAGGDASNHNHGTIIWVRDGDTDTTILLCDDFLPSANGQFWRCEFDDKVVPPASADPPSFPADDRIECPLLEITQGYIIIGQAVGSLPDGADLCLVEVWKLDEGPSAPVPEAGTLLLFGSGLPGLALWARARKERGERRARKAKRQNKPLSGTRKVNSTENPGYCPQPGASAPILSRGPCDTERG